MKTWLISLHKGPGSNTQFLSQAFNGQDWTGDITMPGTGGVSNTPAAVEFNSNLYAFYQRNQTFYYKVYDGEVWTSEAQVPETGGVNAGVAAAAYNGRIYPFYSNPGKAELMYKTYDGASFGTETKAPVAYLNHDTPGATVLGNTLYVFCRGPGPNEPGDHHRFWYAAYDGNLWQGAPTFPTR